MDGILIVNKDKGFTSHDVCAVLRGVLHTKKIGHTGTLDPDARGVLPVLVGKATKLSDMLIADDKIYEVVMKLGTTTDTLDISGEVLCECEVNVCEEEIRSAVTSFIGEIMQVPPMYSAIKVDGKKLYELARAGKEIERKPRKVFIEKIEIEEINSPYVRMKVHCSKGTYIRTLCDDIGKKLKVGGMMCELVRLRSGSFDIENSSSLEDIKKMSEEEIGNHIIGLGQALSHLPVFKVNSKFDKALYNGNMLKLSYGSFEEGKSACERDEEKPCHADKSVDVLVVSDSDEVVGIYYRDADFLKPRKMLLG